MISRFERFSFAISEISRCWHKIAAEEMEKYGLKGPHAIYLVVMSRYEDGITATKLGELCGRDKADVSRAITIMENEGLVVREGINNSFYRALLKLTDSGRYAADQVKQRAHIAVEMAGGEVSLENRQIFYDTLEHIADKLRLISSDGLPKN